MLSSAISATFVNTPDFTFSFTLHSICTVTLDNFPSLNASNSYDLVYAVAAYVPSCDAIQPYFLFISLSFTNSNPSGK